MKEELPGWELRDVLPNLFHVATDFLRTTRIKGKPDRATSLPH